MVYKLRTADPLFKERYLFLCKALLLENNTKFRFLKINE